MIHHWIFISFFFSTISLFSAEVNLPTQKDVTEALQTIGKFLKDGSGPTWLTSLVTKQSAPLTTEDLMKEILNSTAANETVKQAANIIKLALDEQKRVGTNDTQVIEFDGWKDLVDNIEGQEDIICLYRKSYNISTERSDDWQKFLKNISPEYTIYLALDMGQKYVICLKKINILDRNITSRNLNTENQTSDSLDPPKDNTSITINSPTPIGSRSLNNEIKSGNDEDKCDLSDAQPENDNYARRTLPNSNHDSPCNRPIILMVPPNYMYMGGYSIPVFPQIGYQNVQNVPKAPMTPIYPQYYTPNLLRTAPPSSSSSSASSYPADKYQQIFDYGRKRLPVTPRPKPQDSPNDNGRMNPNRFMYGRNGMLNSPNRIPVQSVRSAQSPRFVPPQAPKLQLTRSSPSWPPTGQQYGYYNPNFMFHPPPQYRNMRPQYFYPPNPVNTVPALIPPVKQNCASCTSPCDRPILLKVLMENPLNQPVKVELVPNGEYATGRRQMSQVVETKDEKKEETPEGNEDKELG